MNSWKPFLSVRLLPGSLHILVLLCFSYFGYLGWPKSSSVCLLTYFARQHRQNGNLKNKQNHAANVTKIQKTKLRKWHKPNIGLSSRKKEDFCTSLTKVEKFQLTHVCQKASATKILTICNSILTNQKIAHQLKFQICFVISWNSCRRSKFPSHWLSGRLLWACRHVRKLEVLSLKPGSPSKAYLYLWAVFQTFQFGVLFLPAHFGILGNSSFDFVVKTKPWLISCF